MTDRPKIEGSAERVGFSISDFRKWQISQWNSPPRNAYVLYKFAKSGLSRFVFWQKPKSLVLVDCSAELKNFLSEHEIQIGYSFGDKP